jgi:alcohol dehydrogenase class IV
MQFEFATAARIIFGAGALKELPALAKRFGRRAFFVTGSNPERTAGAMTALAETGIQCSVFRVPHEPTIAKVREGAAAARSCNLVIGLGGGSVIDGAKAIAALASNSGEPLDYLEVIGQGRQLENASVPWIAVPTTAGTGTEVTRNAVLDSPEHGVKASLRSPLLLASAALVDPALTLTVPPAITAACGLDTLTQLLEPYVSARANTFTDMFCVEGMKRVASSLRIAFRNGSDLAARESMSFASLLSGLALANAGLGVVHGFASPLGGMLDAPHGALCAAVLPAGVAINIRALRKRAPQHKALQRYRDASRMFTGNPGAEPDDLVAWLKNLTAELQIPALRAYGLRTEQIPQLVEKAARASSMKANPIELNTDELTEVAERAL